MRKIATMLHVGRAFGPKHGALRLGYELQRSTGLMARRMRSASGWHHWALSRIASEVSAQDLLARRRDGKVAFFFHDARSLADAVKRALSSEGERRLLAEANAILNGTLPFFGKLHHSCGFPPDWFQNPITRQKIPVQQPWTALRFASAEHGDLKFLLEPSRFLFIYPLARAYAITGDDRFAEAFWVALENWMISSPPMAGPLWICGQECSLRILAWSFGFYSFLYSRATTPQRTARLFTAIAASAWRTAQSLNYARSQRSNHLISEAVGLWTAGSLYPELKEAQRWRDLGTRFLREAVLDQITAQGVSHQHSANYQRMIVHLLLWALRLSDLHCVPVDPHIRERTASAVDFLRSVVDPVSGRAPNFGSNDGSLIFPLSDNDYEDHRPTLQVAAGVLERPALPSGSWNEAAAWFGMKPKTGDQLPSSAAPPAGSGYHRIGDKTSWALIHARQYSRRPFQADQLHVDLWWHGLNLARDAGTYLYNGDPPWDNGLSRSLPHNTVTMDGCDQMRRVGRFLWVQWAQARGKSQPLDHGRNDYFEGEHDGYKRLGVIHRRMVRWLHNIGWVIVDDLLGERVHDLRLHWLCPDLPFETTSSPFQVRFRLSDAQEFSWNLFSSADGEGAIVRAGQSCTPELAGIDSPILGWESPTYSELRPAVSVLYRTWRPLPVRFVTCVIANTSYRVARYAEDLVVHESERDLVRIPLAPGHTLPWRGDVDSQQRG